MITEAELPVQAVAPIQPISFTSDFTIPVGITSTTSAENVALVVPAAMRYVSVIVNFDHTITWHLDPGNSDAIFDDPPIVFLNNPGPLVINRTNWTVTVDWQNVNEATRGRSFPYRLCVVVTIDGARIPVTHDPTVHNDPPTL